MTLNSVHTLIASVLVIFLWSYCIDWLLGASAYKRISSVKRTLSSWFSTIFVRRSLITTVLLFGKVHIYSASSLIIYKLRIVYTNIIYMHYTLRACQKTNETRV